MQNNILSYKPYENSFNITDLVCIKTNEIIESVNTSLDSCEDFDWYILNSEAKIIQGVVFRVINIHYFHGGIPIYTLRSMDDMITMIAAEFYLSF